MGLFKWLKGAAGAEKITDVSASDPLPVQVLGSGGGVAQVDVTDEVGRELGIVAQRPRTAVAADHGTAAANTVATVALASGADVPGIAWSYSAAPTGGRLRLLEGVTVLFDIDITSAGPGYIPFSIPKRLAAAGSIELAAAGAGVIGKVNLL